MRRRTGRAVRALVDATDIPTYDGPRPMAGSAEAIRFLRAPGWLRPNRRVYAVGDIHGQSAKLAALHGLIAADLANRPVRSAALLYLGDFINQGPDGAGVLTLLLKQAPAPGLAVVALLGDHERMLLDALDGDRAAATDFLWAGGRETLAGWGVDPSLPPERWEAALPVPHVRWLRGLAVTHREDGYFFAHAGIRPGVPLRDQSKDDLLCIRQPFLSSEQDFGVVVVHGHASAPSVHIGANRLGLDTGAGIGGRLSCAVLEDRAVGLLAA